MVFKRITSVNNVTGKTWTSDQPESKVDKVIAERIRTGELGKEGEYNITITDIPVGEDNIQKFNKRFTERVRLKAKLELLNPKDLRDKDLADYIQDLRDFVLKL